MAGYPVDNEYNHNEEQIGKGSSIGGDRSNDDLLSILGGAFALALCVIVSIVFPIFGIPILVVAVLAALGKLSEVQDDMVNKRRAKKSQEDHIQGQMPAKNRRPMDEMF